MYKIEIEIYEGKGGELQKDEEGIIYPDVVKEGICAWMYRGDGEVSYQQGKRFNYPEDWGLICPWLASSWLLRRCRFLSICSKAFRVLRTRWPKASRRS